MNILIDRLNRCNENLKLITIEPEKSRYSVTIEKNNALHFILDDENDLIKLKNWGFKEWSKKCLLV